MLVKYTPIFFSIAGELFGVEYLYQQNSDNLDMELPQDVDRPTPEEQNDEEEEDQDEDEANGSNLEEEDALTVPDAHSVLSDVAEGFRGRHRVRAFEVMQRNRPSRRRELFVYSIV